MFDITEIKNEINNYVDSISAELIDLSQKIHSNPELCYQEYKASSWLSDYLCQKGFCVAKPIAGLETAFKSEFSKGEYKFNIGILAEYDALPMLGHACGHNIICTSAVGAFLSIAHVMNKYGVEGKVTLIGTPAEEGGMGKAKLIEAGEFNDIDCAIMMHPTSGVTRIAGRCLASHTFNISYKGKPAHAASRPHEGVNALDAANIFFHAVSCLRQQVTSDARMHGIITEGGDAANIIPQHVKVQYMIRAFDNNYLESLRTRVINCIKAGAIATGCEVDVDENEGCKARSYSTSFGELCRNNFKLLNENVIDGYPDDFGSTDFGDVSQIMPTCNPYVTINNVRISSHTEQFRDLAISKSGERAIILSSKAMSYTIADMITDETKIENIISEFKSKMM